LIGFACPGCDMTYQVKDEFAGRQTKCRKCGGALLVPTIARPKDAVASQELTSSLPTTQILRSAGLATFQPHPVQRNLVLCVTIGGAGLLLLTLLLIVMLIGFDHPKESVEDLPNRESKGASKKQADGLDQTPQNSGLMRTEKNVKAGERKEQTVNVVEEKKAGQPTSDKTDGQALAVKRRADEQREEDNRRQKARDARRQQIFARLDALPEEERRQRTTLLTRIADLRAYTLDAQQYLAQLQSDIQGLRLDITLGRAFGAPQAPFGTPREQVLQLKLDAYNNKQAALSRAQASLRQAEAQLSALPIMYEQERNRLLAELKD
jgi:hypothetical protein